MWSMHLVPALFSLLHIAHTGQSSSREEYELTPLKLYQQHAQLQVSDSIFTTQYSTTY